MRTAEPLDKFPNAFLDPNARIVSELPTRFINVGERDRHVTRLKWLPVDNSSLAQRFFEQLNQVRELNSLRFSQIENLVAKLLLRRGENSIDCVADLCVIARGRSIA